MVTTTKVHPKIRTAYIMLGIEDATPNEWDGIDFDGGHGRVIFDDGLFLVHMFDDRGVLEWTVTLTNAPLSILVGVMAQV